MADITKLKTAAELKAELQRKQADLDLLDDQIMGMPEMAPDAPLDMHPSSEFDMLSQKREELEEEIQSMREGVQLISEWEKFKGGQWSEEIKMQLNSMDSEIANAAGGEGEAGMMDEPLPPPPAPTSAVPAAPAPPVTPEAPAPAAAPELATAPEVPPAPEEAAPLEPPMASAKPQNSNAKSANAKKNEYLTPLKKRISASSDLKKEGSTMANETAPTLREKLANAKAKREAIKKEARIRTAAAYTIANTMIPGAPVEKRQAFASSLLEGNDTKSLVAALRQTAKNAHYAKIAEQFKQVHKMELNDLLEDPGVLSAERKAVESEIKGEAKNAADGKTAESKVADDRKDAGPQSDTYNDGRGCGGGKHSEPKELEASNAGDRPDAGEKPGQTVNLSEGKSASEKVACGDKCAGCENCKKEAAEKKHEANCDGKDCKCAAAKEAAVKTAEPAAAAAPAPEAPAAPEAPMAPEGEMAPPAEGEMAPPTDDNQAVIMTDEKKMEVKERIDEVQEAVKALEQEIIEESEEEPTPPMEEENEEEAMMMEDEGEPADDGLDLASVFDADNMDEKVSSLANEGEDHTASEDYFAPTSAKQMEAALEDSGMQVASIQDYFSMQGSDNDPLASLIASDAKSAASVEGFDVIESMTGEAANHFKQNEAGDDKRDNEADHDEDLFAEAMKGIKPEEQGAKRTPQDSVPKLERPKAAAEKKATIQRIRPVAAAPKTIDIAAALFGSDDEV